MSNDLLSPDKFGKICILIEKKTNFGTVFMSTSKNSRQNLYSFYKKLVVLNFLFKELPPAIRTFISRIPSVIEFTFKYGFN